MPTTDKKVNLYNKKLLSLVALKDQFLDYLQGEINEVGTAFFAGASGTLDYDTIGLNNAHGGSSFDIDTTNARKVIASNKTIDLVNIAGSGKTIAIAFENTASVPYYVGVFYAEIEDGLEVNPRTGDPEYKSLKQSCGDLGNPDLVTDGGTYIRLRLNTILESGASHAGRTAKAWLVDPVSSDEAVAFYSGLVQYADPNNYLEIPYAGSDGPLGQDTGAGPPSTTATDYKVCIEGVSWRKGTDLSTVSTCAYLGKITGGTPPTFDISAQPLLQIVSLDRAYNGIPGPGLGRNIYVDSGAVGLITAGSSGDEHNSMLKIERMSGTDFFRPEIEMLIDGDSNIPFCVLEPLQATIADALRAEEIVDIVDNTVTFTRPTDLFDPTVMLEVGSNVLWIKDGDDPGFYEIVSFTATTCVCAKMQGGTPAWVADTGLTATILHPRFVFGDVDITGGAGLAKWRGLLLTGKVGKDNTDVPMLTLLPSGGDGKLVSICNNRVITGAGADPRDVMSITFDAIAKSPGAQIEIGKYIGTTGGEDNVCVPVGMTFNTQVQGVGSAVKYAVNIKPQGDASGSGYRFPSARQLGLHNDGGIEIARWEPWGRMADSNRFCESFGYITDASYADLSHVWKRTTSGSGCTQILNSPTNVAQSSSIQVETANATNADGALYYGPGLWVLRCNPANPGCDPYERKLNFYARARIIDGKAYYGWYYVGIGISSDDCILFEVLNATGTGNVDWLIKSKVATVSNTGLAGDEAHDGLETNNLGWKEFYMQIDTSTNTISYYMTGMTSTAGINIKAAGLGTAWYGSRFMPFFGVKTVTTTTKNIIEVDHIEVWDEMIQAGPKE